MKGENEAIENLQREKEALSDQVKQLIKAEGKLYEYQEELDQQLKEYKALYDLNRRLNELLRVEEIFDVAVAYVIEELGFERAVFFRRVEETGSYCVCSLEGYYDPAVRSRISQLTIEKDAACLTPLWAGKECVVCTAESTDPLLMECREKLLLHEYLIYPLGYPAFPHSILFVGNSAENAPFYRKVELTRCSMFSMGNLVGLVSSLIENRIYLEKVELAREQERRAEAKYRSIFENAAEGIFQRTREGKYLDANPSLAHMLGYSSPHQLMTEVTNIGDQLYVDRRSYDELMRLVELQGKVEGFEARMYRKDRSVIWGSVSLRTVYGEGGSMVFYEGMLEEITERKLAEEALRESEQQYRQLSQALEERVKQAVDELREKDRLLIQQGRQAVVGEMISNIAHQWRQPLNLLALLAQELLMTRKKGELTDQMFQDNLEKTLDIIRSMSKTIDDFRYFFRPDREKVEFRVAEPVEKALSLLAGSFETHGIRVEVSRSEDPVVTGYLNEFVQVLLNILINAREALAARHTAAPAVRINLSEEDGRAVITIADNAGGIPEEIIEKIFDPYFTTKGPEQGVGIGLFMCKTIIEKSMNGRLTVRNLGDGAEFKVEI